MNVFEVLELGSLNLNIKKSKLAETCEMLVYNDTYNRNLQYKEILKGLSIRKI